MYSFPSATAGGRDNSVLGKKKFFCPVNTVWTGEWGDGEREDENWFEKRSEDHRVLFDATELPDKWNSEVRPPIFNKRTL